MRITFGTRPDFQYSKIRFVCQFFSSFRLFFNLEVTRKRHRSYVISAEEVTLLCTFISTYSQPINDNGIVDFSAFRGEETLRRHLSTHDAVTYPPRNRYRPRPNQIQRCKLCDYTTSHGNMKKHIMKVHGEGGRVRDFKEFEYSCNICEKKFRLAASLENHLKTHDEVRDFHCTFCKQSFRKANYLRLHIDGVHLNKRPNKCDQCDAAYLVSNDLRRHKLQRHSTERPFECYYCGKRYALISMLKVHLKGRHRTTMDDLNNDGDSKK